MEQLTEYRAQVEAFLQSSILPALINAKTGIQQAYATKVAGTQLEHLQLGQITPLLILQVLLGGVVVRFVVLAIYRLYFHPLRNFPGPFLARTSNIYSLYYDVRLTMFSPSDAFTDKNCSGGWEGNIANISA